MEKTTCHSLTHRARRSEDSVTSMSLLESPRSKVFPPLFCAPRVSCASQLSTCSPRSCSREDFHNGDLVFLSPAFIDVRGCRSASENILSVLSLYIFRGILGDTYTAYIFTPSCCPFSSLTALDSCSRRKWPRIHHVHNPELIESNPFITFTSRLSIYFFIPMPPSRLSVIRLSTSMLYMFASTLDLLSMYLFTVWSSIFSFTTSNTLSVSLLSFSKTS